MVKIVRTKKKTKKKGHSESIASYRDKVGRVKLEKKREREMEKGGKNREGRDVLKSRRIERQGIGEQNSKIPQIEHQRGPFSMQRRGELSVLHWVPFGFYPLIQLCSPRAQSLPFNVSTPLGLKTVLVSS